MNPSIVVLKFGSSVLQTEADLPQAIDEIYREWRAGRRVIAVVSAFAGHTDRRFAETRAVTTDLHEQAAWVAGGEEESGTKLAAALVAHGVSACYVDARAAGLRAHGEPHESTPVSLNAGYLRDHLQDHAVLVVPGFIAHDIQGRTVLLGRGGSDLTALFVAKNLDARCRLLKDVDGVYESDPAVVENHAQRFNRLSWRTALEIGGRIIQPRALQFAQSHGQSFEVACVDSNLSTLVDAGPDEIATVLHETIQPLRVVLLGLGTVGLGVYAHLVRRPDLFEVVRVVVRDLDKPRRIEEANLEVPKALLSTDVWDAIAQPADLVIETIGGIEPTGEIVHAALSRGRAVVTANKALIASRWWEKLSRFAAGKQPRLKFGAAVGGAVPVLETVTALARQSGVVQVRAILNGTCNFILDQLEQGIDFDSAVALAQSNGFAEADPHDDLVGLDAARKLELIARAAFGEAAHFELNVRGIVGVTASQAALVREDGLSLKLVGTCERDAGHIRGVVKLYELPASDFLSGARAEQNRVEIVGGNGQVVRLAGKGAGRWPTALSILGDVHEYLRDRRLVDADEQSPPAVVNA
ncbi:homoserine dehydrogenase [Steroidobacter sp.]|uniref:homoserine dehydrogenase n=1 Tax=Steroidobacter sp. TaxID=1978227 RepID=UPI001A4F2620|nr:homoserine dehydrogenase [Steroidobacter sp.]MBL8268468.1 homoserine dehydrogenase [Steroidobacter sp.]